MNDAIRKPCHNTEKGTLMGGQNIAEIGTVKDVFEGREDSDPYWRSPRTGDEAEKV